MCYGEPNNPPRREPHRHRRGDPSGRWVCMKKTAAVGAPLFRGVSRQGPATAGPFLFGGHHSDCLALLFDDVLDSLPDRFPEQRWHGVTDLDILVSL